MRSILENFTNTCSQVEPYSGEVCRDALTSLQMCFSGETSPPPALNVPSMMDQQTGERNARNLIDSLHPPPTPECREAILPFLCLSIFQLCDSSNRLHSILKEDCLSLREDICAKQWNQSEMILDAEVLPVCEDLPDVTEECIGKLPVACKQGVTP